MSTSSKKILIVEDDIELAEWMETYLNAKGFSVNSVHCGKTAVEQILATVPDLVILDGMLPGMDGFEVCKAVRTTFEHPIIMLTAKDEEADEVLGLEMGADDYLTKPVRARALLSRIKKHLQRQQKMVLASHLDTPSQPITKLQFNNLTIDRQDRKVTLNKADVKVSTNEFELLWVLASQAGKVVERAELVNQLRGFDYDGFDRSIDLKISRLRKKLSDNASNPVRIKTIWGKGYLFTTAA